VDPLQSRLLTPAPLADLSIEGLTVSYGPVNALSNLDLEIASGELFVLLGGSGSGKTTLLRTLGGFIEPSAGRIRLGGLDITHLPPHRRPVNTTFQSYALFPHMTVADNVAFGLRRQRVPKPEIARRVGELLDLVRLRDFAARKPDALSGGQRQRVALARALAPRHRLLLLDEPLSALDRSLREQTRQELLRIQAQTNTTFIMVTHDQDEALAMATRIGLLENGRLAQIGTPADLYERPTTRYVAAFMGNDNVFPATRLAADQVEIDGIGRLQTTAPSPVTPFWVAIRPERLRLINDPAPNTAPGTILTAAYFGDSADYAIRLDAGATLQLVQPLGAGFGIGLLSPGTTVTVAMPSDALTVLSA
jgi:putrescine transport system ATP-binding protein